MTSTLYLSFRDDALSALYARQLQNALYSIEGQIDLSQQIELRDRLLRLREDYELLLVYYKQGKPDPQRYVQRQRLLQRAFELSQLLHHRYQMGGEGYRAQVHRRAMEGKEEVEQLQSVLMTEADYVRVFDVVWSSYAWASELDATSLHFLQAHAVPYHRKTALVAALTLSLLASFSAARLSCLIELLVPDLDPRLYDRIRLGIVLVAVHHGQSLSLYPDLELRIRQKMVDSDDAQWLRQLQIALLGVQENERCAKKMEKELLPQLEKMAAQALPMQEGEAREATVLTPHDEQFAHQMKRMVRLHEHGVDTSYFAFQSVVAHESFFEEAAHWFGAYEADHPEVKSLTEEEEKMQFLLRTKTCDTDRLGTLKLLQTAQAFAQRLKMVREAMEAEGTLPDDLPEELLPFPKPTPQLVFEMQEEAEDESTLLPHEKAEWQKRKEHRERRASWLGYLHDLYRYFHLFRHRHEGENPFRDNLLLTEHPLWGWALTGDRFGNRLGNAYYALGQDALAVEQWEKVATTPVHLHRLARCYARLKQADLCVATYLRILEMDSDDLEALQKLVLHYMHHRQFEEALVHMLHLESLLPKEMKVALTTAQLFMELGLFEDGLERAYKILYYEPEHREAKVCVGWALLNLRRWDEAEPLILGLLDEQALGNDYFNAGHLHWLRGRVPEAVRCYVECVKKREERYAASDFFESDEAELRQLGLDDDDFAIMLELINDVLLSRNGVTTFS